MSHRNIRETKLPGVGVELDFSTETGRRIGVISHNTGRKDLLVFDKYDPDMCSTSLQLTEEEAQTLSQMLGEQRFVETEIGAQQTVIGGMAIDWIRIGDQWRCSGRTLFHIGVTKAGVTILAVIRNEETHPSPPDEFILQDGDTVIMIGKPEQIQQAYDVLQGT